MDERPGRVQSVWERVRDHALVRAAVVFGSATFFLLQILDVLGVPSTTLRALAILAGVGFIAGEAFLLLRSHRPAGGVPLLVRVRRWLIGGHRWVVTAAVLLLLGGSAWVFGRRLIESPVRPGTDVIAVMPFIASGEDVEDLGTGMVSLLATNLDQVGGIRTIDPATVLHGWRRRAADGSVDLEAAIQIGRELGAGAIVWGTVAAVREAVQVTGEIYTVDGRRVASHGERGDVDDLHALVDRLSVQLLREIWRSEAPVPSLRLAALTTESPVALRAFLRGERHLRSGRYDSATVMLEEAVRVDSTFALAWFRLSEAYGWALHIGAEPTVRAAEAASRFNARLPERERSLTAAHLLHENGDFAAIDTLRSVTRQHPDDALAWYMLGDALHHARPMLEPPSAEIIEAFRRAVDLDPTPGGMFHVLEEALYTRDRPLFDEFLERYRAVAAPGLAERWEQLALVAFAPPDSLMMRMASVSERFIEQRVPAGYGGRLQAIVSTRFATELALDPAELIRMAERAPPEIADRALNLRVFALADLGRVREASVLLDSLVRSSAAPGPPAPFVRVLWAVSGVYPRDSVAAQLMLLTPNEPIAATALPAVRRFLHLAGGDADAADAVTLPAPPTDTTAGGRQAAVRMAGDAWTLHVRGDTAEALTQMREAIRRAGYSASAVRPFSGPLFVHAAALARRADTRAEGIRRLRALLVIGTTFTVPAWLALAETLEASGDHAGAAEAYAHVLRLWKDADPHLQPHVDRARDALARLTGDADAAFR
ncbi:MAG TPA: hypothetical protein VFZ69_04925 [Longimicrobiales bacterium]